MRNINSGNKLFESKKNFVYNTHYKMPKIRYNKKRRRVAYQGIVNQEPAKITDLDEFSARLTNAIQLKLLK